VSSFFPQRGFLGTGAPFGADLNLVLQIIMGATLIAGALLAKHKCYKAHGICQTTVLLLNLIMTGMVMWPSFRQQVEPALLTGFHKRYYRAAILHVTLGGTAEILGLYIVMVAGTSLVPHFLRFTHWKWWMRTELGLWGAALLSGVGTYCAWYIVPFR